MDILAHPTVLYESWCPPWPHAVLIREWTGNVSILSSISNLMENFSQTSQVAPCREFILSDWSLNFIGLLLLLRFVIILLYTCLAVGIYGSTERADDSLMNFRLSCEYQSGSKSTPSSK